MRARPNVRAEAYERERKKRHHGLLHDAAGDAVACAYAPILERTVALAAASVLADPPIACTGSAHVLHDGLAKFTALKKLGVLHVALEVVGHALLSDRFFKPLDDGVRGLLPAHVAEHHLA